MIDPRMELALSFKAVMESPAGRRVLEYLDAQFGGNPYAGSDHAQTDYNCGRLAVLQEFAQQYALALKGDTFPKEVTTDG